MDWRNRCCLPSSVSTQRFMFPIPSTKRKEMAMRSNGLLKWLMIPVALLVLFAGIRLLSGSDTPRSRAAGSGSQLTPEEMQALGIAGDTRSEERREGTEGVSTERYRRSPYNNKKKK